MIDKLELLAIKSIALKDPEYFHRRVCRYYSEKFHPPLMEVYELPWAFVFTNYLEHLVEANNDREDIYNLAIDICYPEKRVDEEEEIQDWIKRIEEEEEAKRQAKKEKEEKEKENPHTEENQKEQVQEEEIHMDENLFSHLEDDMENDDG